MSCLSVCKLLCAGWQAVDASWSLLYACIHVCIWHVGFMYVSLYECVAICMFVWGCGLPSPCLGSTLTYSQKILLGGRCWPLGTPWRWSPSGAKNKSSLYGAFRFRFLKHLLFTKLKNPALSQLYWKTDLSEILLLTLLAYLLKISSLRI